MNYIMSKFSTITLIIIAILIPLFLSIGWIKNLIKFTQLDFQAPYKAETIRGIGLTPIGAIVGWINIKDN